MEETTPTAPSVDLVTLLRQEEDRLRAVERAYDRQLARVELLRELLAALQAPASESPQEPV